GGLLTQASILKVTANGTTTSPVLRGAWAIENLLGIHVPPPPPVPAVEPDLTGATTLRQQLDQHRNDASCASCHSKIDPPGFALESFDAIGGWREWYRIPAGDGLVLDPKKKEQWPTTYKRGLPVDSTGKLPTGEAFGDSVALPFLAGLASPARGAESDVKRRFVAINLGLGFLAANFTPSQAGPDYEPTKYLQLLQDYRSQFTIITGTSHPNVDGGHH